MSEFKAAFERAGAPVKAHRSRVRNDFHGKTVADPYRHLEDLDAPETVAWTEAQNERFERFISNFSRRDEMEAFLKDIWDYPKTSLLNRYGETYIDSYNPGLAAQDVIRVRDSEDGEPRVLIDPNTLSEDGTVALSGTKVSPNGKYIAYMISESGSDAQTLKVRNIQTGEDLPDMIENCRFTSLTWDKDSDEGFSYSYPSGKQDRSFILKHHKLGDALENDKVIFAQDGLEDFFVSLSRPEPGNIECLYTSIGTSQNNGLLIRETGSNEDFKEIFADGKAAYSIIGEIDGEVYMETNHEASKTKVVKFLLEASEPENWTTIIPEHSQDRIEFAKIQQGKLFVNYNRDCADAMDIFDLEGNKTGEIPLPPQSIFGMGKIHEEDTSFEMRISGFTQPGATYEYNIENGELKLVKPSEAKADLADCIVERLRATSKDGTEIPMTVIRHPNTKLDGSAAVKLYGYGGFNVALGPGFSFGRTNWVREGGIYVQANLRGGNEFGREWHEQGALRNKQNVFDDFIACAEHLIEQKYTSPERLAIEGGSNGGLLTAATMLQRPDLFGAVMSHVPVTDMLRFHKFTYGSAWKSDYGDPEKDPEDFKVSMSYSPLHNVERWKHYPPLLVATADHDDRVVPSHAFKFVAEMQAKASKDSLVLMRLEKSAGHGAGKPTQKIIAEILDEFAFVENCLGPIDQNAYKLSLLKDTPENTEDLTASL